MLEKFQRLKPWCLPALTLLVAVLAGVILFGNLSREVWTYYSDGEGRRAKVEDERARPVLWQDPEQQYLAEQDEPSAGTMEASFSADGTTMILVRWEESADMYLSTWDGRTWSPPQPVDSINTAANERSPALSRDGTLLYFASDRKGGPGGYDLYVAKRKDGKWGPPKSLSSAVNTAANELGPALSADEGQLYFSSDRKGASDDIFVSKITTAKEMTFAKAEAVDDLNSKAADVQAALTSRGDHVFIASDRDRDRQTGFKVYLSRVVDGEPLPPEEVDLYIEEGDVTDPAVRMDGFDLLFSSGKGAEDGYQLFRSTTREVVGYTDLSRWEDFKALIHHLAWWILLAIAALIALIYILEKWRDMTTLFHKCLAGSAVIHLIVLLLAMLWLIAQTIEKDEQAKQEVEISIDALAEEELAMESAPEEVQLTDTTNNLESEKMEAEFGAPGFEEQQDAEAMPEVAQAVKESAVAEAQPQMSNPSELPVPEPTEASSLLNDLAAAALPDIETPVLEENENTKPQEVADPSEELFEPEVLAQNTAKTEATEMTGQPLASEAETSDVTEVQEPTPLAEAPRESVVEATAPESPASEPTVAEALESPVLSDLAPAPFLDPAELALDEGQPEMAEAPADTSQDEFNPDAVAATMSNAPAASTAVADSPNTNAAAAAEVVASASAGASSALEAVTASMTSAPAMESLPATTLEADTLGELPELALADPGAPTLEESNPLPAAAPADPSRDLFQPAPSLPSLTNVPSKSESVADAALATQAETAAVTGGEIPTAEPVINTSPPEMLASAPSESIPPAETAPPTPGSLPDLALLDPGAPLLEEANPQPRGAPANPAKDLFTPGGASALATSQSSASGATDAAVSEKSDPTAVVTGGVPSNSLLTEFRPPAGMESTPAETIAVGGIETALPELFLIEAGAPQLEEGGQAPGTPADTSKDQFAPGDSLPTLATTPAAGRAVPDQSATDQTGAQAVAEAQRDIGGESLLTPSTLLVSTAPPSLSTGGIASELAMTTPLESLLPGRLEVDVELDAKDMATLVQKQRGKPGLDTIKQMGGSDGTEEAISAAIAWLVDNQEADGRWDTKKHGAKYNYDHGGTGLVLLCFYGWGERHDQPGKYQANVRRALDWLLERQREDGYLGEGPGMMYSHAIATIALCEAYGLTKDQRLKEPATRAIAYTLDAQSKTLGGWRYAPGNQSDTSVTGWHYMALHSARMAGLSVPDEAFERVRTFLDRMGGGKHGGLYGYQQRSEISRAMVATGMFCRQLDLVAPGEPMMQESARLLKRNPMKAGNPDLYYVYYATLALYQHQGPIWLAWNERLKEILPQIQNRTGAAAGSWDRSASMTGDGGRVVSTALATLSLEVYYRLLPMYGFRNTEAEAPEQKTRER